MFLEISQDSQENTFVTEHLWVTASVYLILNVWLVKALSMILLLHSSLRELFYKNSILNLTPNLRAL